METRKHEISYWLLVYFRLCPKNGLTEPRGRLINSPMQIFFRIRPRNDHVGHAQASTAGHIYETKITITHKKITELIPKQIRFGNLFTEITELNSKENSVIQDSHLLPRLNNSRNKSVR